MKNITLAKVFAVCRNIFFLNCSTEHDFRTILCLQGCFRTCNYQLLLPQNEQEKIGHDSDWCSHHWQFGSDMWNVSSYYLSWKSVITKNNCGENFDSRTRESGPVFELSDLQHALTVFTVEDMWCCNVIQRIVLQGRRRRVKLGVERQRVGGAVSRSWADGADSFGCRLQSHRWTFMEAVLFTSAEGGWRNVCLWRERKDTWKVEASVALIFMSYLLGLCLLVPTSGGSISSSEESGEEAKVVLSRRCSCWDRYWAGVCLAARAQWRSSLCRRGRFAWQGEKQMYGLIQTTKNSLQTMGNFTICSSANKDTWTRWTF